MRLTAIASVIPLDIPIALCTSFHGRLDVLHSMQTYFYGKNGEQHGRRTFAICGLGMAYTLSKTSTNYDT